MKRRQSRKERADFLAKERLRITKIDSAAKPFSVVFHPGASFELPSGTYRIGTK